MLGSDQFTEHRESVGFLCYVVVVKPARGDHAPAVMIAFTVQWAKIKAKNSANWEGLSPNHKRPYVLAGEALMKT